MMLLVIHEMMNRDRSPSKYQSYFSIIVNNDNVNFILNIFTCCLIRIICNISTLAI